MKPLNKYLLASLLSFQFIENSVWAGNPLPQFDESTVQIVQSVPAETDLTIPGIPLTADIWIDMIRNAKSTIDLAQFYLSSGITPGNATKGNEKKPLERIIEELEDAGKRGVRIRLLVSESLLTEDASTVARFMRMRGATIRFYDMTKSEGDVHHAKYWIIDGKEVFVGSQNFDWRSLTQIQELGVKVQDPILAKQLSRVFDLDWRYAKSKENPPIPLAATLQINSPTAMKIELVASPPKLVPTDIRTSIEALIDLIQSAKKTIQVQLLDYSPTTTAHTYWPDLDNAIRAAALRGVKVQIMVADGSTTQKAMHYLKSLSLIPGIQVKMVSIPAYSGGNIPNARMIHSKYMVIDNEIFWIGTSNWSKGYFYNSRNVELIFRKPEIASVGVQVFQKLWTSQYGKLIEPTRDCDFAISKN